MGELTEHEQKKLAANCPKKIKRIEIKLKLVQKNEGVSYLERFMSAINGRHWLPCPIRKPLYQLALTIK